MKAYRVKRIGEVVMKDMIERVYICRLNTSESSGIRYTPSNLGRTEKICDSVLMRPRRSGQEGRT
jgi:hypothetical protein